MSTHNVCFRAEIRKTFTRYTMFKAPDKSGYQVTINTSFYFSMSKYVVGTH